MSSSTRCPVTSCGDSVCDTGWLLEPVRALSLGSSFPAGTEMHTHDPDADLLKLGKRLAEVGGVA
jgi:hypothetical protein